MKNASLDFHFESARLLSPILPDNPEGEDLRFDPVYDQLRTMRKEDDATLAQGVWKSDLKRADWPGVAALSLEILEKRSKDLQVAVWLAEAWLHIHGFAGCAEGLSIITGISERFWDGLYPRMEGGDQEFRIAPLVWMDRKFSVDLKLVPLTAPDSSDVPRYTWADWERANEVERLGPANAPKGGITLAQFHQSALFTPLPHLEGVLRSASRVLENCERLDKFFDEKFGRDSPGLTSLHEAIQSIVQFLSTVLVHRGVTAPAEAGAALEEPQDLTMQYSDGEYVEDGRDFQEIAADSHGGTGIQTRSDAYRALLEAADFLARTEPHSPTPYLVRRAVSWGSMPLNELLPELVRNPTELSEIYRLLNLGDVPQPKKSA